ncbi:hypothetical protein ACFL2R_02100 [Patescibacteria group bacterium]
MAKTGDVIEGVEINRRRYLDSLSDVVGLCRPVVNHSVKEGHSPRFIIRCGCCSPGTADPLDIHYFKDQEIEILNIGGVQASVDDWRRILLPLLGVDDKETK